MIQLSNSSDPLKAPWQWLQRSSARFFFFIRRFMRFLFIINRAWEIFIIAPSISCGKMPCWFLWMKKNPKRFKFSLKHQIRAKTTSFTFFRRSAPKRISTNFSENSMAVPGLWLVIIISSTTTLSLT